MCGISHFVEASFLKNFYTMILIVLMRYRIPSDNDNFKRIIKDQTLRTSFHHGFLISIKHLRLILGGDPLKVIRLLQKVLGSSNNAFRFSLINSYLRVLL